MIDLHLHTTASDGLLTPAALVATAAAAGLHTISVTDHDTTAGLAEAAAAARALGVRLIDGIEITAVEGDRDVHLLGYFFDRDDPGLRDLLLAQRTHRVARLRQMAARLAESGAAVDVDPLAASRHGKSVGRPLLADALVAAGHAADRRDAFDRYLVRGCPAFVARTGPSVGAAVDAIRAAGGVASLAHPGLLDADDRIALFVAAGVMAIEARHSDHNAAAEARYRAMADDLDVAISGGSDFHGDDRRRPIGGVTISAAELARLEARVTR